MWNVNFVLNISYNCKVVKEVCGLFILSFYYLPKHLGDGERKCWAKRSMESKKAENLGLELWIVCVCVCCVVLCCVCVRKREISGWHSGQVTCFQSSMSWVRIPILRWIVFSRCVTKLWVHPTVMWVLSPG